MSRVLVHACAGGLAALALLGPADATACGGFFCSSLPVDQSKERIVFGIDETRGEVEVHVQIFYQGDAERFAWVVPVPTVPEVGLSTDALFQQLEWQTGPRFQLDLEERGRCEYDGGWGYLPPYDLDDAEAGGDPGAGGGRGVDVEASGQTGPYDWTVVNASSQAALVTWLKDPDGNPATNDAYDLPPALASKLGAYIQDQGRFIAFRLRSDASVGDIAPIRMTYTGTEASIPLVLTSIAATPDMRLQPYVFASKRAVPKNYLHVRINPAKINWLTSGSNYDAVVTMAADEAGGQAFATDFFGPTDRLRGQLWRPDRFDLAAIRAAEDAVAAVQQLIWQGFPANAQVLGLLRDHVPLPEAAVRAGIDETSFYNCLECYRQYLDGLAFDAAAFADDLDELVVTPMREAESLFTRHAFVTRMTSSMSPEEMTLDPLFVLNGDMTAPVSNEHRAKMVVDCGDGGKYSEAPRWIELADGTVVQVPPDAWFRDTGRTFDNWLDELDLPAAVVIERTGATGQPVPVSDAGPRIRDELDRWNRLFESGDGGELDDDGVQAVGACAGCSTGGRGAGALALLLGVAGVARRRR